MEEGKKLRTPVWEKLRSRPSWRSTEEAWRSPNFSYAIAVIFFFIWLYLEWHLPTSIWAITFLTIAVAFMALRGEMAGREKWFWFLMVLLYGGLTIRADSNDRRKADKELTDNFNAISLTAKDNLHTSLTDSEQRFETLLQNQNDQFQTMLDNQNRDFSQTLGRLDRQEHKQNEEMVTLFSIKTMQEDARLDSKEINLVLQAIRGERPTQMAGPSPGRPPEIGVTTLEPQAIKKLKIQALELARDIYDWIASISKDAPKFGGPIPQNAEEAKNLDAYLDRLNTEWARNLLRPLIPWLAICIYMGFASLAYRSVNL
jgi:hypothetical protein